MRGKGVAALGPHLRIESPHISMRWALSAISTLKHDYQALRQLHPVRKTGRFCHSRPVRGPLRLRAYSKREVKPHGQIPVSKLLPIGDGSVAVEVGHGYFRLERMFDRFLLVHLNAEARR